MRNGGGVSVSPRSPWRPRVSHSGLCEPGDPALTLELAGVQEHTCACVCACVCARVRVCREGHLEAARSAECQ